MTVQIGQVYRHPRYIRRVEIVMAGPVSCTFKYLAFDDVETTMRIEHMQHWPLLRDICDHCGESYPAIETYTAPDPDDGRRALTLCPDCYASRAYLDRAGDEAEVGY